MVECKDKNCPYHGELKVRGIVLKGKVVSKKARKTVVIEREIIVKVPKYERFMKKRVRLSAHLPECLSDKVNLGDIVEVGECRKISKTKSFVVLRKIGDNE